MSKIALFIRIIDYIILTVLLISLYFKSAANQNPERKTLGAGGGNKKAVN